MEWKELETLKIKTETELKNKLFEAVWNNNISEVEKALSLRANVNTVDKYGNTALIWAVSYGNTDIAKLLIEHGADINAVLGYGDYTALILACFRGNTDIAKLLLEHNADANVKDHRGMTALLHACWCGNGCINLIKLLLERGADVNAVDNMGRSALGFAYRNGYTDIVNLLLKSGADITKVNSKYQEQLKEMVQSLKERQGHSDKTVPREEPRGELNDSFLSDKTGNNSEEYDYSNCDSQLDVFNFASANGDTEKIRSLLKPGNININKTFGDDDTALINACRYGHTEIVRLLLSAGADINMPNWYGNTPFMYGCWSGETKIVKLLIEHGVNIDTDIFLELCSDGTTELMEDGSKEHIDMVKLLLEYITDVNIKDNCECTALTLACKYGNVNIVKPLLEHGADPDIKDNDGNTALMYLAREGDLNSMKLLAKAGADLNIRNSEGQTAFEILKEKYPEKYRNAVTPAKYKEHVRQAKKQKLLKKRTYEGNIYDEGNMHCI